MLVAAAVLWTHPLKSAVARPLKSAVARPRVAAPSLLWLDSWEAWSLRDVGILDGAVIAAGAAGLFLASATGESEADEHECRLDT